MARWAVIGDKGSSSVKTVLHLNVAASSPRRAKLYDWAFGNADTPADSLYKHIIQRATAAPTGSAKTPNSLDPADTLASTIVATDTVTVDGTLTANAFLANVPLNARAAFRWVAPPYGEILLPATASNGVMLGLAAASTTLSSCHAHFEEY